MAWTETVAVVRDIAIIALTLVATMAVLIVFAKVTALVDSIRRIIRGVEDVGSAIAGTVGPAGAGAGFLAGIARAAAAFVTPTPRDDGREEDG